MTIDLDEALRGDARRWRAEQHLDLDLESSLVAAQARGRWQPIRRLALGPIGAAAAVVLVVGGVALAVGELDHSDRSGPTLASSAPAATHHVTPRPPATRLPGLGPAPSRERTLLRDSGHTDRTWHIARTTGRGDLDAVCVGGGSITVSIPGSGGFEVDCTGIASGASLPTMGTTVEVTHAGHQRWRVAVFGR